MSSSFDLNFKKNNLFDDSENKKIESISKKKPKTYKELYKIAMNQTHKRYGAKAKLKYKYIGLIMENLIFNKNTHLVSTFKDYMIWDYIEEFLKRYYKNYESNERVPKFASFYKNYLKFFCIPTFKDIFCNEMIHNYSEKKAELFYNENYRNKKEKNSFQEDYGLLEESESDDDDSSNRTSNTNMNIEKTIFNETVKKKIERYSPINTSMALPESDTKLKPDDSGLLITSSNETSLVNIMNGMIPPPPPPQQKNKKKQESQNKSSKNTKSTKNNSNSNLNNINNKGESSSSYRMSQKNLISSTLNKFSSKTLETLLNSQMKNRNKNVFHYSDYSKLVKKNNKMHSKDNTHTNSNNALLKNNLYNNNDRNSKNKIMSYIGIYKKKSIPKSRNENKSPEEIIKSQTQITNFIIGPNSSNNNINNIKNNNNININQLGNNTNLSNRAKNITSINNYNLNYKQSIQKSRNQQQSTSINSNTYSKYSFDKINNIKKKININLIKNNNIEFILNQLKIHPFCTLKKSATKKAIQSSSNRTNKKEEKRTSKKSCTNILSTNNNNYNNSRNEHDRYNVKSRTINNNYLNNNQEVSPNSHKRKFQNSPSAFDFLKKTSEYIRNMHTKSSHSKDIKVYKKSARNCSYNEKQKSYADDKNNINSNKTNKKMSFDGLLSNKGNTNPKKPNNNNGAKHIHNVNININNQINIGGKQFHELFDIVKKNANNGNNANNNNNIKNIFTLSKGNKKNNYISRNKNQSLDFNAYTNNQTNNANSIGSNKMNSLSDIHNANNNNIYKTQYKANNGFSGTIAQNKNKNSNNKKIRLTNNALFRSMKVINNNTNDINYKGKK